MNSQELRALQEAYSQVYELDEASYSAKSVRAGKDIGKPGKQFAKIAASAAERYGSEERGKKVAGAVLAKLRKEETDLYDIILSHLLDEGYADTQEQAEAIMVNMSEDWRESIVEGAAGAFVPSKVDDSNNRRDMLKNRYGQDVSPRIPGPSGGGQFEKPSSNPAGALRLAKTSSKGDTKTA